MHRMYLLAKQNEEPPSSSTAGAQCSSGSETDLGVWLDVLGSTGNVYRVSLTSTGNRCACLDFAKGGGVCKHLLFVMLRVLKLSREDHRVWQTALTASELQPLLASLREGQAGTDDLAPEKAVLRGYRAATVGIEAHKVQPLPAECPICFEEISEGATASYAVDSTKSAVACGSCGHHLHNDCHKRWAESSSKGSTCPLCRSPWDTSARPGGALNLAAYAAEQQPTIEELYPETHQWMSPNRRRNQPS